MGDLLRWFAAEAAWMVRARAFLFGWNLFLAGVPLALALVLFRRRARRSGLWWTGVVAFVLFLPNAAYVLTDVIHLDRDARSIESGAVAFGLYLPAYLLFFVVGFSCYVLCLMRLRRYLAAVAPHLSWPVVEYSLHGLTALAIYLGRIVRLNSWQVVTAPDLVLDGVGRFRGPAAIVAVAVAFVMVVTATLVLEPILEALVRAGGRGVERLRRPHGPAVRAS